MSSMTLSERTSLLQATRNKSCNSNLSVVFAIICIVDVFGVFPVISLPKAVINCGFYGIIVIGIVCSVQIYTAILLGRCWLIAEKIDSTLQKKNRYPYSALVEITYGPNCANFISFLLNITVFAGGIPNLIVASQNLQLLGLKLSNDNLDVSYCYWIIALGVILCPILWLGSPKDMKLVCSVSVALVIVVFFLVIGSLTFNQISSEIPVSDTNRSLWESIFISYGIISFQYDIHPSILTIQIDMKDKSKLITAIIGGFGGMFSIITIIAAVKFGMSLKPSILETLSDTIPLHMAAFLVALQLCLSLVISNSALYQHIEDCMDISRAFNHRRCVLRTTLTLFAIIIAQSVPRFDLVMSLIGGTLTGPLVFVIPPLIYLKMLSKQKWYRNGNNGKRNFTEKLEIITCILIVIFSCVCIVITTYVNVNGAVEFANFSQPCILNVSSVLVNL